MVHRMSANVHTRIVKFRESFEAKLASRTGEEGVEAIEVVVLSVVGLLIVVALGAAIKSLVESYTSDLKKQ